MHWSAWRHDAGGVFDRFRAAPQLFWLRMTLSDHLIPAEISAIATVLEPSFASLALSAAIVALIFIIVPDVIVDSSRGSCALR